MTEGLSLLHAIAPPYQYYLSSVFIGEALIIRVFVLIHPFVGALEHLSVRDILSLVIDCVAFGQRQRALIRLLRLVFFLDHSVRLLEQPVHFPDGIDRKQYDELIAADAVDILFTEDPDHDVRFVDQRQIADLVTVVVVDILQSVDSKIATLNFAVPLLIVSSSCLTASRYAALFPTEVRASIYACR